MSGGRNAQKKLINTTAGQYNTTAQGISGNQVPLLETEASQGLTPAEKASATQDILGGVAGNYQTAAADEANRAGASNNSAGLLTSEDALAGQKGRDTVTGENAITADELKQKDFAQGVLPQYYGDASKATEGLYGITPALMGPNWLQSIEGITGSIASLGKAASGAADLYNQAQGGSGGGGGGDPSSG